MFRLKIAGLSIDIINENPMLMETMGKYVRDRHSAEGENDADIVINVPDGLIEREMAIEGKVGIDYGREFSEYLAIYRALSEAMLSFDGFLMHASVLEKDGVAYAFTAPSGTGKSTHARIWRENIENVHMVNDDKPIIRLIDGIPHACGTPWCGKHMLGENVVVPLGGICFLEQAAENSISRREPSDEMHAILSQIYRPTDRDLLIKTLELADRVFGGVPIWRMKCNMKPEAAFMSYKTMCVAKRQ